jgi:hypothetical protein
MNWIEYRRNGCDLIYLPPLNFLEGPKKAMEASVRMAALAAKNRKVSALPVPYKDVKQGVPEAEFSIQFLLPLLVTPNDNYIYHLIVKSLCLINQAKRHEDVCESGGMAPSFLTLALDRSEWSATRPGKRARYPLYRRLGGSARRCG